MTAEMRSLLRIGCLAGAVLLIGASRPLEAGAVTPGTSQDESAAIRDTGRVDTRYGCLVCHADKRRAYLLGVHSERGVRCHDCHGGNPEVFEVAGAHSGTFRGSLGKLAIVDVCTSCHADANLMRQYGLPSDQVAELRTSRHGLLLFERGSTDAPTCSDCHDPHTTLKTDDARSNAYPTNIPGACATCHEDEALMAPYGIPTDQVALYRRSTHGTALFEDQNFAAPSCIGCHGSHAALPPAVGEISNVCGRCHVRTRRAFAGGPHGRAAEDGRLPGCTACHSNHATERLAPERIAETCVRCHAEDSAPALRGQEIEAILVRGAGEIGSADEAIRELVRSGHEVTDTRFRYRTAITAYQQIVSTQHSLDVGRLEDLARVVGSLARDIRREAEVSAEERWEHKLFLVPVWFFALAVVVLASFQLRRVSAAGRAAESEDAG